MTGEEGGETTIVPLGDGREAIVITMEDCVFNDYLGYAAVLEELVQNRRRFFTVDLSGCEHISSNALGILVYYHRLVRTKGGGLVIILPRAASTQGFVLRYVGIDVPLTDTLEEALALLQMAARVSPGCTRKARVLIASPDRSTAGFLGVVAEYCGHMVTIASSPEEALREARNISPDMVVVDVGLPARDGIALCRAVRERPETCGATLCVLVAEPDRAMLVDAVAAGCDTFIAKPIVIADCEAILRKALGGKCDAERKRESLSGSDPAMHRNLRQCS